MLLCLCLFTACASEEGEHATEYGDAVKVSFKLNATDPAKQSRANTGQYVAAVEPWELIHSYRAVITDNAGKIVALADKTLDGSTEYDPVDIELRRGTYKAYGFANIDFNYLNDLGITMGATMPDLSEVRYFVEGYGAQYFNGETLLPMSVLQNSAKYIPMTSVNGQEVTVTDRINQTFGIEVRRLFAKLEFSFTNNTGQNLNLQGLSVSNLTVNKNNTPAIFLMNHEDQGTDLCYLPETYEQATQRHNYGSSPVLIETGSDKPAKTECFYVLESKSNPASNSFELGFDLVPTGGGTYTDNMRYALTNPETLTLIHRNDWIKIPITIGDWLMDLDVYCYPPIGGYPEAEVEKTSETEFHTTFLSPGDIAIYANFHKFYDETTKFYLTDFDRIVGTPSIVIGGNTAIFDKQPTLRNGEILARLSNTAGTAYVDLTTTFYPDAANKSVTKTMTRRIYITRKV